MEKENCWEHKKCGRQPGGDKVEEFGVCPASLPGEGEGANHGKCRGRICWAIAGTFCGGGCTGNICRERTELYAV